MENGGTATSRQSRHFESGHDFSYETVALVNHYNHFLRFLLRCRFFLKKKRPLNSSIFSAILPNFFLLSAGRAMFSTVWKLAESPWVLLLTSRISDFRESLPSRYNSIFFVKTLTEVLAAPVFVFLLCGFLVELLLRRLFLKVPAATFLVLAVGFVLPPLSFLVARSRSY